MERARLLDIHYGNTQNGQTHTRLGNSIEQERERERERLAQPHGERERNIGVVQIELKGRERTQNIATLSN